MFKRVVSWLLLPATLLGQWASAAHCHGCSQVAGHDRSPHIHLSAFPFAGFVSQLSSHSHDGPEADDHDGDDAGDRHDCPAPLEGPFHPPAATVDLPHSLTQGWNVGRAAVSMPGVADLAGPGLHAVAVQPAHALDGTHDPPPPSELPTYLRIKSLLI